MYVTIYDILLFIKQSQFTLEDRIDLAKLWQYTIYKKKEIGCKCESTNLVQHCRLIYIHVIMRTNVTISNLHDIIRLHTMEQEKRHFDNNIIWK